MLTVAEKLAERIRTGALRPGDKLGTEAGLMQEFGVSRTVVREALSNMQASGMVSTRQGVGTFVVGDGHCVPFSIDAQRLQTLPEVLAVFELRLGVEAEAAALAAQRRTVHDLLALSGALAAFSAAIREGGDAAGAEFECHLQVARAAHSPHFISVLAALGSSSLLFSHPTCVGARRVDHVARLHAMYFEHESIYNAIAHQDSLAARAAMRTHLGNCRERRREANA
jgi:DNA-binding FadR family transcriptional regulator